MMMGMTSTLHRYARDMIALSVALLVGVWSAKAHDETKYPDLREFFWLASTLSVA